MKKLSMLLAVLLLLSVAVPAGAVTVSDPGVLPIVNEPVTLKVWAAQTVDRNYETILTTTAMEEMSGVHIQWDLFSSTESAETMFNLLLASQDYPDIFTGIGFTPERINMCIEGNVLLPLNEMIETQGINYKTVLAEQPHFKDYLTAPDGNIYTFMYTDTGVHKDSEYKMYVYTEWLDKLGIQAPTTPEEYKEMLIKFRDEDPNGNGQKDELPMVGYYNGRKSDPICYLMNPFQLYNENYYVISDEGEVQFIANTDGWRDGLRYLNDLYENGLILEETYVQDHTQFQTLLNKPAGETIVGAFPFWFQGAAIDINVLNWTDYQAIAPLKGPTGLQQSSARKGGDFRMISAISSTCKEPMVAFKWLDYMIGEEGLYFGLYGVEGTSYEWVDAPAFSGADRSIKRLMTDLEALWNSGTFPRYDKAEARYASTMDETQKNRDNTYVLTSAAKIYEPYYVYHNVPLISWCSDADVIAKKAEYQTLFNDFIAAQDTAFVLGDLDIDNDADWENYKKELQNYGLEDYMAVLSTYFLGK